MEKPTFLNGKYRLDRLVVAHDDVTIWAATDMMRGTPVQLSIFERGSTVLQQGKSENGMFVAIDTIARTSLELVEDDRDEDVFAPMAPASRTRRRAWPWAAAVGVACAAMAVGAWHFTKNRAPETASETTITAAQIPEPVLTAPPEIKSPPPPPAPIATQAPVVTKPVVTPPEHHETIAPLPKPRAQKPVKPRPQSPPSFDPLTI